MDTLDGIIIALLVGAAGSGLFVLIRLLIASASKKPEFPDTETTPETYISVNAKEISSTDESGFGGDVMNTPTVFISYSHDSSEHDDRVLDFSNRLREDGIDCTLDQYETSPPEGWPKWMDRHIKKSDFVIIIFTETYYRRVMGKEESGKGLGVKFESTLTYQHIYNADAQNTKFIPFLFELGDSEYIPTPLQGATYYCLDTKQGYEDLYCRLTNQPYVEKPELGKLRKLPQRERKEDYRVAETEGPEKISLAKLPSTNPDLFGREEELAILDAAWDDPGAKVISLVAWGGVGKTALVNKWLLQMDAEDYRGAERVYGYSFYSQGAAEDRQASADPFIAAALEWFGDDDPTAGSPWDKGERLAQLTRKHRTLLILDGLEPLQYPPGPMEGRIKDPGLDTSLRELSYKNPGLCVVTTRLEIADSLAQQHELKYLSPKAGAQFLSQLGVQGTQGELEQASQDFGGHALALTLLGNLLKDAYGGDVRYRGEVAPLEEDIQKGGHARRVMESYERWLGEGPELAILHLIGLFDCPAEGGALDALRAAPVMRGLTDALFDGKEPLSEQDWDRAVTKLRHARLLLERDPNNPDALDAHPLVREHFGEKLKESNPAAWKEAHSRLYEYYKTHAKEYPETLEEMMPLYTAVAHGCQAGRHQEAMEGAYYRRILREEQHSSVRKFGSFGADLSALSGFFEPPWHQPVAGLTDAAKGFVLNMAGFCLRALGRLAEAVQPMQAALEAAIAQENWQNAATSAFNLSELHLTIGGLTRARDHAQQSVGLADRGGYALERIVGHTALADALHQAGRLEDAGTAFREAERMLEERLPEYPLLFGTQGFRYCDLLLDQGEYQTVQNRAGQTLGWMNQAGLDILSAALDHLSLGRAHLLQTREEGTGDLSQAADELDQAVKGLRQAGTQHHIPRGLLARAELHRVTGNFDRAQRDLDEAMTIAARGGMRLYEADCHLGYARLYLTEGEEDKARESLDKAKGMIQEMGYHRRDKEVEALEKQLENIKK